MAPEARRARGRRRGLYRDPAGELVVELDSDIGGAQPTLMIEQLVWHRPEWCPDTIIAGDHPVSATGVFALTARP